MYRLKLCLLFMIGLSQRPTTTAAQTPESETGPGIGIYPTGTETGIGFRSAKDARWALDLRVTRTNLFTNPGSGSMVNEISVIRRLAYYERVRFHIGVGARTDWNLSKEKSFQAGVVAPIGVEAFPFPFQNAGLFFEAAPFCTWMENRTSNLGIRTVAGFVFYFIRKGN